MKIKEQHKIFGIGLSRTGTKSLTRALEVLGFRIAHYPIDRRTYKELYTGQYNFSLLQEKDGITDITVSPYYAQLDALYPEAGFILTIREKETWLTSMEKHYRHNPMPRILPDILTERKIRRFLRAAVYGTYTFKKDRMSYVYDTHYQSVIQHFKGREHKLLVINIPEGEGWEKLCPFLKLPIPTQPFPKI
jgi:integrase